MNPNRKPIYLAYIADNVYHVYKFSNYGIYKIKLIHAGIAFDNLDSYTKKYKNLIKKYNLTESNKKFHYTADTKFDFLNRLFLTHDSEIRIPRLAREVINSIVGYKYYKQND